MRFLCNVRWHPPDEETACTHAWIVKAVRGDCYTLILEDAAGLEIRIPLAYIEWMNMERKG